MHWTKCFAVEAAEIFKEVIFFMIKSHIFFMNDMLNRSKAAANCG